MWSGRSGLSEARFEGAQVESVAMVAKSGFKLSA
jgi:hypothetical protein